MVFQQMVTGIDGMPPLFEGNKGRKRPIYNTAIAVSGMMVMVGTIIAHSIAQVGVGPCFCSGAIYKYLCTGDFSMVVPVLTIEDATAKTNFYIEKINKVQDRNFSELVNDAGLQELMSESGATALLTAETKKMIIQNLIVHDVLGKRKISLDQIRRGLETLDVLQHLKELPDLYKDLFTCLSFTPGSIVKLLKFEGSCEEHSVAQYLKRFILETNEETLEDFLVFATASKMPPALSGIKVKIEMTDAIFAQACFPPWYCLVA